MRLLRHLSVTDRESPLRLTRSGTQREHGGIFRASALGCLGAATFGPGEWPWRTQAAGSTIALLAGPAGLTGVAGRSRRPWTISHPGW